MIHEEIVTLEVAKLAKEKGFNERTRYYYETNCVNPKAIEHCWGSGYFNKHPRAVAAPTQSLLQRWLREEKGYYVYPLFDNVQLMWDWVCREKTGDKWIPLVGLEFHLFPTYELALEDALKYTLENLV